MTMIPSSEESQESLWTREKEKSLVYSTFYVYFFLHNGKNYRHYMGQTKSNEVSERVRRRWDTRDDESVGIAMVTPPFPGSFLSFLLSALWLWHSSLQKNNIIFFSLKKRKVLSFKPLVFFVGGVQRIPLLHHHNIGWKRESCKNCIRYSGGGIEWIKRKRLYDSTFIELYLYRVF